MPHPLVLQLRFTRSEFRHGLKDVSANDAIKRFEPINCISWMIGHLAFQEQMYWLTRAQGITLIEGMKERVGWGSEPTTPPLDEMWAFWTQVTKAADPWLDTLTSDMLLTHPVVQGKTHNESIGTMLRRCTYHYWYHLGEAQAVRQLLGHTNLPQFVGSIGDEAPYISE